MLIYRGPRCSQARATRILASMEDLAPWMLAAGTRAPASLDTEAWPAKPTLHVGAAVVKKLPTSQPVNAPGDRRIPKLR